MMASELQNVIIKIAMKTHCIYVYLVCDSEVTSLGKHFTPGPDE